MKLKRLTMEEMKQLTETLKALEVATVEWEYYWYDNEYHGWEDPTLIRNDGSRLYMSSITDLALNESLLRLPKKAFDGPGVYRLDVEQGKLYKIGDIWMPQPELEVQMLPEEQWDDLTPGF